VIEKNIIHYWHDFDKITLEHKKSMEISKINNPDYKVIFANDNFMNEFIQKNYSMTVLSLFKKNKIPASRSDIARLMLLYEYGGFYVDVDMQIEKSLNKLNKEGTNMIVIRRDDKHILCPDAGNYINGFIAASKGSDIIKFCIDKVLLNLLTGEFNEKVNMATGPSVMNQALMQNNLGHYKVDVLNITSLLNNFITVHHIKNISKSWVCLQKKGIISVDFYKKQVVNYEKAWFSNRFAFSFSFSFFRNFNT